MPAAQSRRGDDQTSDAERFAAVAASLRHRGAGPARTRRRPPAATPPTVAAAGQDHRPPPPTPPPGDSRPNAAAGQRHLPAALAGRRGVAALALVLLALAALAGVRLARGEPAWALEGALVVDASTGQRYLVADQVLRPTPTLTVARLAGARGPARQVGHRQIAGAAAGPALDVARDLPQAPPRLPDPPTGLTACTGPAGGGADVEVYADAPAPGGAGGATGALVSSGGEPPVLLADGQAHLITPAAITALGLGEAPVLAVPAPWLDLTPTGPALDVITPGVEPGPGLAGIGSLGEVVADPGGTHYLVTGAGLAPAAGPSAAALVPPPARMVSDELIAAAPTAAPFGAQITPPAPPRLAGAGATLCTRSFDAALSITDTPNEPREDAARARVLPGGTTSRWHAPPGAGALLAPADLDAAPAPAAGPTGIVLVADGAAHPVATTGVLGALGYTRQQTVLVPAAWLGLAAPASALELTTP